MSLNRIEIRHFQSLRKVDLDLGQLTVIVGASSSGKSALMRAFRGIASNVRGTSVITRGQKKAAITVRTDTHTITLERSEVSGLYRVADLVESGSELVYTKLNGGVPDTVTKVLRIAPAPAGGSSVNFASQFDRPYLLDDSGANVARVLGELTNVNTIFEAVRLANKRRLAASSLLKTRRADLAATQTRLEEIGGLKSRMEATARAQLLFDQARLITERMDRLSQARNALLAEEAHAGQLAAQAQITLPDGTELADTFTRFADLVNLLRRSEEKTRAWSTAQSLQVNTQQTVTFLEQELATLLKDNGVCPTCGQSTV